MEGLGAFVVELGRGTVKVRHSGSAVGTGLAVRGGSDPSHCGHANGRPQLRSAGILVSGPGTGAELWGEKGSSAWAD